MKRVKTMIKSTVCALLAAVTVFGLCSCQGKPPALEEVKDTYTELIEGSYEINGILFGDSMATYSRDSEYAQKSGLYTNVPDGYYCYEFIAEENTYQTEDEIRERALEIYSEDYISSVLDSCFNGFMDDAGDAAVQPKYLSYMGRLMLNTEYEVYVKSERRYDCSTMEIIKPSNGKIVNIQLDATDGETTSKVQLTFVLENGEWRLDSPTY